MRGRHKVSLYKAPLLNYIGYGDGFVSDRIEKDSKGQH